MSSSDDATREDIMIITWQNSGNAFVHEMPDGLIDIQQKCRNKVWRSRKYTESPEKRQTVCEIVWYSAPMDHCWRRIQVLDTQENSLLDTAIPETNPFLQTSARLHEMLAGNPEDGALKCLFEHFTSDESEDNRIAMVDRLPPPPTPIPIPPPTLHPATTLPHPSPFTPHALPSKVKPHKA